MQQQHLRSAIVAVLLFSGCPNDLSKFAVDDFDSGSTSGADLSTSDLADAEPEVPLDQPLLASSFEQGCTFDSECSPVADGDLCQCAPCQNNAVTSTEFDAFEQAARDLACSSPVDRLILCQNDCPNVVPVCAAQRCDVREPVFISGDQYRRDCVTPNECVLISVGEVCSVCRCEKAAIHQDEVEQFQIDSDVDCSPDPDAICDCEPATEVDCVENVCVVLDP